MSTKYNRSLQLKQTVIDIMKSMTEFTKAYPKAELPAPSNEFTVAQELLAKGEFNLAICGKVKSGKTSLINALIGKDLLPVNSDVATARVFKVINSADGKDHFYLVYANGDREQITQEQLVVYGSQAAIDAAGQSDLKKTISYIEVQTKVDFLPKGVSIIDTPGIGSTYPQHTVITKQFIKLADATLFVMNPTPLESIEIEFIKEIASVSPNMMFVTTKIDLESETAIASSVERNTKQIEKHVGETLCSPIKILCMSSLLLKQAAGEEDTEIADFNIALSGYNEVKDEMNDLVFRTIGYYRVGQAYNMAVHYYQLVLQSLLNRKDAIIQANQNYEGLVKQYNEAYRMFTEKMGDAKRSETLQKIEDLLATLAYDFNQIFAGKGVIATKYKAEIEALTADNIEAYSADLGERIITDIQNEWNRLTSMVQQKMSIILAQYNEECMMVIPDGIKVSVSQDLAQEANVQGVTTHERMSGIRSEMLMGTALTGAIGTIVGSANFFWPALVAPTLPVVAPILVIMGVGVILWGAISGNNKAVNDKLKKNQQQLIKFLADTIDECRKSLVGTSLSDNKYKSLYDGFVGAVRQQSKDSINSTYKKYEKEIAAMKETVIKAKQDPNLLKTLEFLIEKWNAHKTALQEVKATLDTLN